MGYQAPQFTGQQLWKLHPN